MFKRILFSRGKDSILYIGSSAISLPVFIIAMPIFARNLSSDDFAAIGYFNALAVFFIPIFSFSFYNYYMANYSNNSDEENKELLQTLLSFLIFSNSIILVIAFIVLNIYLEKTNSLFDAFPLGIIVLITSYAAIGIGFWKIKLRFERKSFLYFILTSSIILFNIAIGLLLVVFMELGALGRLIPLMFINIIFFIVFIFRYIYPIKINLALLKDALIFSYPLTLAAILIFPITYFDKVLIEQLHDNTEFALYNIGSSISLYVTIIAVAVLQAVEPDIFSLVAKKNKHLLINLFSMYIVVLIFISVCFTLVSSQVIDYLTAGLYTGVDKYATFMVVLKLLEQIVYFLGFILIAFKMTKIVLLNQLLLSIISVILLKHFIPIYEYWGAIYTKLFLLLFWLFLTYLAIVFRNKSFVSRFTVRI